MSIRSRYLFPGFPLFTAKNSDGEMQILCQVKNSPQKYGMHPGSDPGAMENYLKDLILTNINKLSRHGMVCCPL